MLKMKMALAAAAVGFATLAAGQTSAQAASVQMTPLPSISPAAAADGGLLQQVDWRGEFCEHHPYNWRCRHRVRYNYCYDWRHSCAERWGWRTHDFYVCLRRRGC